MVKKKEEKVIEIYYYIHTDDFRTRKLAFSLFDMLGFKQDIVLDFFRASIKDEIKLFQEKIPCRIIKNTTRDDKFCMFIHKIQSNMQLCDLVNEIGCMSECLYVPLEVNLEEFLYTLKDRWCKDAVACNTAKFQSVFDMDVGIYLYFDKQYYESANIENTLKEWEKTFGDIKFESRGIKEDSNVAKIVLAVAFTFWIVVTIYYLFNH